MEKEIQKQNQNESRIRRELGILHDPLRSTTKGYAVALSNSETYRYLADMLSKVGGYTVRDVRQYGDYTAIIDIEEPTFLPLVACDKVNLSELFSPYLNKFYITRKGTWTYQFEEREVAEDEKAKATVNFNTRNTAKESGLKQIVNKYITSLPEREQYVSLRED